MVEIPKDYVLQWADHAGFITERFSSLLARQALVDVTLVCDEQKLRVHKLVLASNSIYFEEILQQDLGEEPIIFLKDLDFEILKAMIEFMYCGETTVSHQYLASLLTAAKIFKIKKLVSVIENIICPKKFLDNFGNCLKQGGDCNLKIMNGSLTENDYVRVRCDKLNLDENTSVWINSNNDSMSSTKNQFLENNTIDSTKHDSQHTLYEESDTIDANSKKITNTLSLSVSDNENLSRQSINSTNSTVSTTRDKVNEVQMSRDRDETYCNNHDLKPILYEQCCDLDINECDQTSAITLLQSCLPQVETNDLEHCSDSTDISSSTVGKCIKVYTHKRRKSVGEVRNKLVHMQCNLVPTSPPSTDSIDLLDEPSSNDVPVTLLTSLDMESAEYILSLSTEKIQSIVGSTISDQYTVIGHKELNSAQDADKEQSNATIDADYEKPVLRRSTRLNQQDSDDIASIGLSSGSFAGTEKSFKKSNSPNRTESGSKIKRKGGKEDRKMPDHIAPDAVLQANKKSFKNKKNASKLIVKKKSACTVASNKEKEELKLKTTNNKFKVENTETMSDHISSPLFMKTDKEDINRALWGDMSDNYGNEMNLFEYPLNTEIPFAVGLLPLRTALEKMQATPDYQPRKTRSSVAPTIKQDATINNLKRKVRVATSDLALLPKKQNSNNESPKTVCHIQIKTSVPSQEVNVKNRKRFILNSLRTLSPTDITDRQ